MSETMQKIRNRPKTPFVSPLQQFIKENCEQCGYYKGKCDLDDQNGILTMSLCITLSVNEQPEFVKNLFQSGKLPTLPPEDMPPEAELGEP